jgi:uncharacterized protein involved in exopolysaccharide biosynthesis
MDSDHLSTTGPGSPATGAAIRAAEGPPAGSPEFRPQVTLFEVLSMLLKRWRTLAAAPILTSLLVAGVAFLVPPTYTATTTFVPEVRTQSRLPSGVAGLAGQLGFSIVGEPSRSPSFYANVVSSRELLERVLLSQYADPRGKNGGIDSMSLLGILKIKGLDRTDSLERGVRKLRALIHVGVDNATGIVNLGVDARYPALAAAVANRMVAYLNDFNSRYRQSQARERRKFTEQRAADAEAQLRQTEAAVKSFYERNRGWQESPQLAFEENGLRRQVDIGREVYLTLRREYEAARIEEVNDTPVITVIDAAVPPRKRSHPRRAAWVVSALVFGMVVSLGWAVGAGYAERAQREQEPDYREFSAVFAHVRRDIARSVTRIGRPNRSVP